MLLGGPLSKVCPHGHLQVLWSHFWDRPRLAKPFQPSTIGSVAFRSSEEFQRSDWATGLDPRYLLSAFLLATSGFQGKMGRSLLPKEPEDVFSPVPGSLTRIDDQSLLSGAGPSGSPHAGSLRLSGMFAHHRGYMTPGWDVPDLRPTMKLGSVGAGLPTV